MTDPGTLANIFSRLHTLEEELTKLADRVSVLEDRTCSHESRVEDLETWQDKVDDKLEAS